MATKTVESGFVSERNYLWLKKAVKYALLGAALACAWRVTIGDSRPFATGALLALALSEGFCVPLAATLYIIASFAATTELLPCISAIIAAVACVAASALRKKCKGKRLVALAAVTFAAVESGFLWWGIAAGSRLYAPLGAMFSLCFALVVFRALGVANASARPTDADLAGTGIILCALSAGAFTIEAFGVNFGYALAVIAAGTAAFLLGKGAGLFAAVAAGLGGALATGSIAVFALTTFALAIYLVFSDAARLLSAVAAVTAVVLFELYFYVGTDELLLDMAAFFIGGALYAAIPKRALRELKNSRFSSVTGLAYRYVTERKNAYFAARVRGLAEIFSDMRRALTAGGAGRTPGADEVAAEIENAVCARCDRHEKCEGKTAALTELCEIAERNGRAAALDVPYFVENDCPKTAAFLSMTAEYAAASRERRAESTADRERREAMGEQLRCVTSVLSEAADEIAAESGRDEASERALKTELGERGIAVADVVVTHGAENAVAAFMRSGSASPDEIAAITGRVLGSAFAVKRTEKCAYPGYSMVEMREKPPFDAVFAVAGSSKNRVATGDTHSFVRLGQNRFMAALCDGMGSGREAGRISETAVELVESFFRAGYPGEFVIDEVNRFLSVSTGEGFAAFDVMVCDLSTRERTIIKLGSPTSYIKTPSGTTAVDGSALPLGALGEIAPFVRTDEFASGDIVVFASDGVTDLFTGDELRNLINNASCDNVETLASEVMNEAKRRSGGVGRDDMTVTAVRVFERK